MKRKPKFDYTRMEKEPPRVPAPWSIVPAYRTFGPQCAYALKKDGIVMKVCIAQSENGAHREGMFFIKEMDF